ncbi:MAG: endolytic transglycosylase MltG [bacterium]|nr:endolytic transglycosylase MltG [bacterium]
MKKHTSNPKRKNKLKAFHKLFVTAIVGVFILASLVVFYYKLDPALLAKLSFYIDLANPSVKIVRIQEGWRKEQIGEELAEKIGWDETEKSTFINAHIALNTQDLEGRYFPKTYLLDKDIDPETASEIMLEEFEKQTDKIKIPASKQIINEDTALKIASLIQREAAGKHDMRLISGIIWNRIFSGMKLQIDATLQYAKGSEEDGWWRRVNSVDKKIESEYNTYLYEGLPPGAIANPGLEAIKAAYNPEETKCMFYLHDRNRKIHCAVTYEEHKQNIATYLQSPK